MWPTENLFNKMTMSRRLDISVDDKLENFNVVAFSETQNYAIAAFPNLITEINREGLFHTPEDCQHDLLFWLLHQELFLYRNVFVFPLHGLSF